MKDVGYGVLFFIIFAKIIYHEKTVFTSYCVDVHAVSVCSRLERAACFVNG